MDFLGGRPLADPQNAPSARGQHDGDHLMRRELLPKRPPRRMQASAQTHIFDGDEEMVNAIKLNKDYISHEILADEMIPGELPDSAFKEWKIDGRELKVWLVKN